MDDIISAIDSSHINATGGYALAIIILAIYGACYMADGAIKVIIDIFKK